MKKTAEIKTLGTPNPVPELIDEVESDDDDNELIHGIHGAQGGEKGNKYQALWMALACVNAVYQPADEENRLAEIILEGSREPFDDIEIKKSDGSLTLFQSKHRHRIKGNNVAISALVKVPPGGKTKEEEKKKDQDSAPFSLLKYFKGMIQILAKDDAPEDVRFILCVSAPFAEKFKNPENKEKYIILGANFWQSSGIFQNVVEEQKESLLCNIHYSQENSETIENHLTKNKLQKQKPRYVRFSDEFINDELEGNGGVLRSHIYKALFNFIKAERKKGAAWITWNETQNNKKLTLFFENLQLWIEQPKVETLQAIVTVSLKVNFVLGVEEIRTKFLEIVEQSAERCKKSLKAQDIHYYLTQVRGTVLTKFLGVETDKFKEKFLLDLFLKVGLVEEGITKFLASKKQVCVVSADDFLALKFLLFSTVHAFYTKNKPEGRLGENWFLIDFDTKPLFHWHESSRNFIEHLPEDIFTADTAEVVIVDRADKFLDSKYGKTIISRLATTAEKAKGKIILITDIKFQEAWKQLLRKVKLCENIVIENPILTPTQVSSVLSQKTYIDLELEFFDGQMFSLMDLATDEYPGFLSSLRDPILLIDILKDAKKPDKTATRKAKEKKIAGLNNYQVSPLPISQPIYQLAQLCKSKSIEKIRLLIKEKGLEEELKKITETTWKYNENDQRYYFKVNSQGVIIEVEPQPQDLAHVVVKRIDNKEAKSFLQIPAKSFIDKTDQRTSVQQLLEKTEHPKRMVLTAEYGSGKSTLFLFLVKTWLAQENFSKQNYEWVVLIRLPEVIRKIKKKSSVLDIISSEAKKIGISQNRLKKWQKDVLENALAQGNALLLIDGWDVLDGKDVTLVNAWLTKLPSGIHFIIGTRLHAQDNLTIPIHQKISLLLFTWEDITNYITQYFESYLDETYKDQRAKFEKNHKEFIQKILDWLDQGSNDVVNNPKKSS